MKNANEPAFPEPYLNDPNLSLSMKPGLTKREYFAVMAMQGYIASSPNSQPINAALFAMKCADELLKQLEQ